MLKIKIVAEVLGVLATGLYMRFMLSWQKAGGKKGFLGRQ